MPKHEPELVPSLPTHQEPRHELFIYRCIDHHDQTRGIFRTWQLAIDSWLLTLSKITKHAVCTEPHRGEWWIFVDEKYYGKVTRDLVYDEINHL